MVLLTRSMITTVCMSSTHAVMRLWRKMEPTASCQQTSRSWRRLCSLWCWIGLWGTAHAKKLRRRLQVMRVRQRTVNATIQSRDMVTFATAPSVFGETLISRMAAKVLVFQICFCLVPIRILIEINFDPPLS